MKYLVPVAYMFIICLCTMPLTVPAIYLNHVESKCIQEQIANGNTEEYAHYLCID